MNLRKSFENCSDKNNGVSCAGHDFLRFTLLQVFSLLYDWLISLLGFCFDSVVSKKLYKEITSVLILQRSFSKKKQKSKTNKQKRPTCLLTEITKHACEELKKLGPDFQHRNDEGTPSPL